VARPRPTRSSTARQIGKAAEPDRWMIRAEPRATLAVELLAQRSGRMIPFVAPAPLHTLSMSDGILKAVQAHDDGATANAVLDYLSREFGMTVRPNHLGIALQRHRRAGRLENHDQRWYLPASAQSDQ